MPRIRTIKGEHKTDHKADKKSAAHHSTSSHGHSGGSAHKKRRPGRDTEAVAADADMHADSSDVKVVDVDGVHSDHDQTASTEAAHAEMNSGNGTDSGHTHGDGDSYSGSRSDSDDKNLEINFPGSEILRAKFPKSFDAAEVLATDWMRDSDFSNLPLPQGPVKDVVQKSLRKAKDIEKQVLASPVTEKVTMQAFTYALKAQGLFNQIKDRVKKK